MYNPFNLLPNNVGAIKERVRKINAQTGNKQKFPYDRVRLWLMIAVGKD